MPYRLAADAVLVLHFAFVLFVVAAGCWLRWPRAAWAHLPARRGGGDRVPGLTCPLTRSRTTSAASAAKRLPRRLHSALHRALLYPAVSRLPCSRARSLVVAINLAVYFGSGSRRRAPRAFLLMFTS